MRRVRWSSLLVLLGAVGCGADTASTGQELEPVNTPGGSPGGTAGGGGTTGGVSALGGTSGGGTLGGIGGGGTFGSGGGFPAGGNASGGGIGMTMVQPMGPCEQQVAQAGPTVPDIMIVLDRSQSMAPALKAGTNCAIFNLWNDGLTCSIDLNPDVAAAACDRLDCLGVDCAAPPFQGTVNCGGTAPSPTVDRWAPAVQGIKALTMEFQNKISFGLTVFPGDAANGGGGPGAPRADVCAAGNQKVPVGLNTASMIARTLDGTQPVGATPTSATLQAVLNQIQQKTTDPDSKLPPQYVLLVTDGQPTCPNAGGNTLSTQGLAQDHQLTIQALDALSALGVKTFVLGYDATVDPVLASKLTEFAMHGGTGDFHPVQDAPSIVEQFTKITATVASCSYTLDKKPYDPTYVLVKVDNEKLELNAADGWVIDGVNITIQGAACTKLKDGAPHQLVVTVECEPQVTPG